MSFKFWLCVTVLSVALAHTYLYTDLLRRARPEMVSVFPRYMTAMWYSFTDAWDQLKRELKWHLETGQKAALLVRQNIAHMRRRREQEKVRRKLEV